eukprot:m.194504 g.194504  ORF g.194504 m.194504 type:complete len:414 (+) comp15210_c0_seq2:1375-2616(+)
MKTATVLVVTISTVTSGLNNGVGMRPTLGWNSWNAFGGALDEQVVRTAAAHLVSSGLAAKGYVYVNLDDTWAALARNSTTGALVPDSTKFPTPMVDLVADIHGQGLKFGIYTDVGWKTCAKRPGSYGHESQDAATFANWGVDFVKSDSCFTSVDPTVQPADGPRCFADYQKFAAALNATKRPMVHSIKGPCGNGPTPCSPPDASSIAHLRRAAGDVRDNWPSIIRVLGDASLVVNASRPGFFADLDILEIGNGGLTPTEERAVFSLWCAVKSPILLGNNLAKMNATTLATVGNTELLAVNQDALGISARLVSNESDGAQIWAGPLGQARGGPVDGAPVDEHVVIAFNPTSSTLLVSVDWTTAKACSSGAHCTWDVRDLWTGNLTKAVTDRLVVTVESHGAAAFRLENKSGVSQ